jgi:hypothetical protein
LKEFHAASPTGLLIAAKSDARMTFVLPKAVVASIFPSATHR